MESFAVLCFVIFSVLIAAGVGVAVKVHVVSGVALLAVGVTGVIVTWLIFCWKRNVDVTGKVTTGSAVAGESAADAAGAAGTTGSGASGDGFFETLLSSISALFRSPSATVTATGAPAAAVTMGAGAGSGAGNTGTDADKSGDGFFETLLSSISALFRSPAATVTATGALTSASSGAPAVVDTISPFRSPEIVNVISGKQAPDSCEHVINGGICGNSIAAGDCSFGIQQSDGNLVLYQGTLPAAVVKWTSRTDGRGTPPYELIMQWDGNLVAYDKTSRKIWASNTANVGFPPHRAVMLDTCEFVIYDSKGTKIWRI